MLTVLKQINIF